MVYLGKNRNSLNIVADILQVANPSANKTKIMMSANLSFSLLEKYLEVVIKAGFIRIDSNKYYQLSELGKEFLREYQHFHERHDQAQKILDSLRSERERLERLCYSHGLADSINLELDFQ